MQALTNIEIMEKYEVQKILTICPHCYNTMKTNILTLTVKFEVIHYTPILQTYLIKEGKLHLDSGTLRIRKSLPRSLLSRRCNGEYDAPRSILSKFGSENIEMKLIKALPYVAELGGAQMFQGSRKGDKGIFIERIEEALDTKQTL